jgi:threonine dehydrogenase-like Zn-dependent dehydrogenase
MKAALLIEPRKLIVADVKTPEPGPGEVLIRVSLAGICGSDHTLYQGRFGVPMPVIPGHEAIGRIEEIGHGYPVWLSDNGSPCNRIFPATMAKQLGASRIIGTKKPVESYYDAFDVIYETSGAPGALDQVIRLAAPPGKIVVLGLPGKDHPVPTDLIVRKELQIMGSIIYSNEFPESMVILKSGQIKTDLLITGTLSLNDLDNALREFASPERMKMLARL